MTNKLNFGAAEEDFPTGLFDDYDGAIEIAEFEEGSFNVQIHLMIRPEDYEYEARNLEPDHDSDEKLPQVWLSMGGDLDTYEIREDGRTAFGPQINKNTRAYKFIMAIREAGVLMNGPDLSVLEGKTVHWKSVTEMVGNPATGKSRERDILYPAGRAVGKAMLGAKPDSRRSRRAKAGEEEEAPARRNRTARTARTARAAKEEEKQEEPRNDEDSELEEKGMDALLDLVKEKGKIRRRAISTELMKLEDDLGTDVVEIASKRETIDRAIKEGSLAEDGNTLFISGEDSEDSEDTEGDDD